MTPDVSFVKDLALYDRRLRVRWATHIGKFFIERQLQHQNPTLMAEKPSSTDQPSRDGLRQDLWDGWREGYVHVLTVPSDLLHWSLVAPALANADAWRQGGMQTLNKQLDDDEAAWERTGDRRIDHYVEAATSEAYDHLAWLQGRRVAVTLPSEPAYEDRGGYKVRDRRVSVRGL